MGQIITRVWTSRGPTGRRVKRHSYGYDITINGKRDRRISAEWLSEADALEAMAQRIKEVEAEQITKPDPNRTFGQLADEYLKYKADHGKRSLRDDRRILNTRLLPAFGASLPVRKLTAQMIAQYEKRRSGEKDARRKPKGETAEVPRVSAYTVTL
jgi:hypothetical protein